MNSHTSAHEIQARAKRIKDKFYAPKPQEPKIQFQPRRQDEHVKAFRAWQAWTGVVMTPKAFFESLCWLSGYTVDFIKSKEGMKKYYNVRRSIVRSIHERYPYLGSPRIGRIVNRDHTTVLYSLGKTQGYFLVTRKDKFRTHTTEDDRKLIKKLYNKGMLLKEIAPIVGFSEITISNVVRGKVWQKRT